MKQATHGTKPDHSKQAPYWCPRTERHAPLINPLLTARGQKFSPPEPKDTRHQKQPALNSIHSQNQSHRQQQKTAYITQRQQPPPISPMRNHIPPPTQQQQTWSTNHTTTQKIAHSHKQPKIQPLKRTQRASPRHITSTDIPKRSNQRPSISPHNTRPAKGRGTTPRRHP